MSIPTRQEAIEDLSMFGIKEPQIYLRVLIEACIDIAANAVQKYPYGIHDRFDSDEKRCLFEILMTFIDYARPEGMRKGNAVREIVTAGVTKPGSANHQGTTRVEWRKGP